MFTRRFNRIVYLVLGVLAAAAMFAISFSLYAVWPSNQDLGREPLQPIAFSHKLHAGQLEVPCLYCHSEADKGPHATVPTVTTCMNCHAIVQPKDDKGELKPAIAQLLEHVDPKTGKPIKPIFWIKVHDVSDFAYFDHSRHVTGAKLDCSECHGPVETMERIRIVRPVKMGGCLDCHMQPPPKPRADQRSTRGPIHCSACHR